MLQTTDLQNLAPELVKWQTWAVLVVIACFGVLGGYARKFTAADSDAPATKYDPIVGGITALAMLMVVPVTRLVPLIGVAIVSGFAGKTLLDALRARTDALVAKQQAADARVAATESDEKRKEAAVKGLEALQRARDFAAAGDTVTKQYPGTIPPDLLNSIAANAKLTITAKPQSESTFSIWASASDDLAKLESDLKALL